MKIKVNPLFFAFALALVAFGHAFDFVWMTLALLVHEGAHVLMAKSRGYALKNMTILPYGAMMSTGDNFDKTSSILIGLAGPLSNFLCALVLVGVWWLFPSTYTYSEAFLYANLYLGIFNLLPVYPLDGSRVVLGFCKNKLRAIKAMQIAGILCSFCLLALFVASLFFGINFSYGIMAVFLFYGATFLLKEQTYTSVCDITNKNYSSGIEQKRVSVLATTPIVRLFHHVSSSTHTTFDIVDCNGKLLKTLTETDLKNIACKAKLNQEIGDFL